MNVDFEGPILSIPPKKIKRDAGGAASFEVLGHCDFMEGVIAVVRLDDKMESSSDSAFMVFSEVE